MTTATKVSTPRIVSKHLGAKSQRVCYCGTAGVAGGYAVGHDSFNSFGVEHHQRQLFPEDTVYNNKGLGGAPGNPLLSIGGQSTRAPQSPWVQDTTSQFLNPPPQQQQQQQYHHHHHQLATPQQQSNLQPIAPKQQKRFQASCPEERLAILKEKAPLLYRFLVDCCTPTAPRTRKRKVCEATPWDCEGCACHSPAPLLRFLCRVGRVPRRQHGWERRGSRRKPRWIW